MNQPLTPQGNQSLAQMVAALGPVAKVFKTSTIDPRALAAGIKSSFASVTFKARVWGIRYRGITKELYQPNRAPVPTIDVIIVRPAIAISKTYYKDAYKEGDFGQPDCWSTNGIKPDPASRAIQNPTCKGCKWDAFGSRTFVPQGQSTEAPRKGGKACSDNKRLAVVPAGDIKNEMYGGPMLLRLTPASFNALTEYEMALHLVGNRCDAVVTRLSFDYDVGHPKIIFTPVGALDEHAGQEIVALQTSELVERILNEEAVEVTADPGQAVETPSNVVAMRTTGVAAAAQPMQPEPTTAAMAQAFSPTLPPEGTPPTLSPEQAEIERLKAELAAAQAKAPRRKRTAPVTPGGQVAIQLPDKTVSNQAVPFTQQGGSVQQGPAPNGSDEGEDGEGDDPPDLQSRIDALLNPGGNT